MTDTYLVDRRRIRIGYAAVASTYLATQAFSTTPSPLYPIYATRDHLSPAMITCIYAAYAAGVSAALIFAGHLSDLWGRRPVLLAALAIDAVSCVVFVTTPSVAGLFVARVVCGIGVGVTSSTATAYLVELFVAHRSADRIGHVRTVSAAIAVGGLGLGAVAAGVIAAHTTHPLSVPYVVLLVVFAVCTAGVAVAPETRARSKQRPAYRPQRIAVPAHARRPYFAALAGVATVFATFGLFVGLAGTVLGQVLNRHSAQLTGFVLFVLFGTGALCTKLAARIDRRLLVLLAGLTMTVGLGALVISVWLPTPSLVLFVVAGAAIGAGGSVLFTASLSVATAAAPPDRVAETLAGFFLSGYLGISVPVVGAGVALLHVSARTTLLCFALMPAAGLARALPDLARARLD